MNKLHTIMAAAMTTIGVLTAAASTSLPHATPASQGIDPKAVITLVDSLQALPATEIHHLMIVRNGHIVAEGHTAPFQRTDKHTLFSCSKTMMSLAVGIAIGENRLRLTDRMASFFPNALPDTIGDGLASLTVRHLLTMDAGAYTPTNLPMQASNWERAFLANPKLGTDHRFRYDSFCTYMLSAIVQRVTGQTVLNYLRPRLLQPLGITEADWEQSPSGVCVGGWGMRLTVESMAKVGQLMLDGGKWEGRQIVPAQWVAEMQKTQIEWHPGNEPSDLNQGYGYQMWRCLEPGVARADGAYGQFIIIDPKRQLVVAINGISLDRGPYAELRCVWRQLMPGVKDAPLKPNAKLQRAMERKLGAMALPALAGKASAKQLAGPSTMRLERNELAISSITLAPSGKGMMAMTIVMDDGATDTIPLRHSGWARHTTSMAPPFFNGTFSLPLTSIKGLNPPYSTAGCYAADGHGTVTARVAYTNWISSRTFTFSGLGTANPTITVTDNFNPGKQHTLRCKN